ncbi:hypothetical protein K7X08_013535 [Anisodus acutangulus]|uniref:PXA domain-containing protein n=1 Tax=Anisodus acutangulus TaxID=402998 RepID=A0A9Q1LLQ4_9SOLA|nr:hypothetical protein K7X08_013535 [Anisodus acutangulus]
MNTSLLLRSRDDLLVLQHLMDGLISYTFQTEDTQCALFRNIVRELLACVVIRPLLNLANPRFINERIESLVVSVKKDDKGITAAETEPQSRPVGSGKISADHFSQVLDPSAKGVELVQLKIDQPNNTEEHAMNSMNGTDLLKDPLVSFDTRSTRSWSSLPSQTDADDGSGDLNRPSYPPDYSYQEENEYNSDEVQSESSNSYTTEDEEPSSVTGLDSPGTQVWDGKNIRNRDSGKIMPHSLLQLISFPPRGSVLILKARILLQGWSKIIQDMNRDSGKIMPHSLLQETFGDSISDNKVHTNRKSTTNMQTTSNSVETNSHESPESLVSSPIDPTFLTEWVPPN